MIFTLLLVAVLSHAPIPTNPTLKPDGLQPAPKNTLPEKLQNNTPNPAPEIKVPENLNVKLTDDGQQKRRFSWLTDWAGVCSLGGAVLAAAVTILAFIWLPFRQKRHEVRLAYVEKQLNELYGPLLAQCIEADSIFRKSELVLRNVSRASPHEFVNIQTSTIRKIRRSQSYKPSIGDLAAWALLRIYLPGNKTRFDLLKRNLHLFGPYPPLSLFLFLTHSTQVAALIDIKEHVDIPLEPDVAPEQDPYVIYPYPVILAAEVVAKVAYLKALQREYQYRMGGVWRGKEIFFRNPYFLVLQLPRTAYVPTDGCPRCRVELGKLQGSAGQPRNLRKELNENAKHTIYSVQSFPLIWGPYTGVELIEMRSWLITKETAVRNMGTIPENRTIHTAFLHAAVVTVAKSGKWGEFRLPVHYRVAQPFDSIDKSGAKCIPWWDEFSFSDLERSEYMLDSEFKLYRRKDAPNCMTTLKDLTNGVHFAYRSNYDRIHG